MSADIITFDAGKVRRYIEESLRGFVNDPPDNDFQRGFLEALIVIMQEAVGVRYSKSEILRQAMNIPDAQP
jgi:hypothetical protein